MSEQPTLLETEPPDERLAKLQCPECGYRPIDDVLPEGTLPKSMREVERLEPPESYEQALDRFDCAGADEGYIICNQVHWDHNGRAIHCGCAFNPDTGEVLELDDDFDGL